jgi:phage-related protein
MSKRKPLVIIGAKIKTPPFSLDARLEAGFLLGRLQERMPLSMPHARNMPIIGKRCIELRIKDSKAEWRVICRIDSDMILLIHVFSKKTKRTPKTVIDLCRQRINNFDTISGGA